MSAGDHLNPVQFSTMMSDEGKQGTTYAHDGDALDENGRRDWHNMIGTLSWGGMEAKQGSSEITRVWTHPDHRRQGIASNMLDVAKSAGGTPEHSTIRTRKGEAWARAQGAAPRTDIGNWKIPHTFGELHDPDWEDDWKADLREEHGL